MPNNSFDDLKGKICVITGGAGVIGAAMTEALASAGVITVILDLLQEIAAAQARQLQEKYGVSCLGLECNVLEKESLMKARQVILDTYGRIDILINGAGGNSPDATTKAEQIDPANTGRLEDTFFGLKLEGFQKVFDLNFMGTLLPTMVFAEPMVTQAKGVVINISSMNSYKPLTKIPAYSAAKAAVNNFTEWLAVHFGKTGVRVNAIAPGFFLTHQNRFLLIDEKTGNPTPRGNKIISGTPMGKYGEPADLQGALLFLCSDVSSFLTGIILPVDGGYSAFGGV
jgi:NAD(P)-dependent dehydrogenase (short-subunit alcohol dehydrogenase family)